MTATLDPTTLRWVAEQEDRRASDFVVPAGERGWDVAECRYREREYRMKARRYRALATRIENKRGKR